MFVCMRARGCVFVHICVCACLVKSFSWLYSISLLFCFLFAFMLSVPADLIGGRQQLCMIESMKSEHSRHGGGGMQSWLRLRLAALY